MSSYLKTIGIVVFSIGLLPSSSFAKMENFLSVSGSLSQGAVNMEAIEQRVFNTEDIQIYQSGTYEISLYDEGEFISNNFFEIAQGDTELFMENGTHSSYKNYNFSFIVKLPLFRQINIERSVIQIKKGSQILLTKKVTDVPFEVVTAEAQNPTFPVIENIIDKKNNTVIYISVAASAAILIGGWIVWRKRKRQIGLPPTEPLNS